MYTKSSCRNSTTRSLIVKRSAAAPSPRPITTTTELEEAAQAVPLLAHIESSKFTQRNHSRGKKIEFPVSPDADALLLGEGITNSNHPQHKMVYLELPTPFTCMGCKEYGAGSRFTCQQCNFELHDFCALAPPVLKAHPLHSQHHLIFYPKPGKGLLRSKCEVCGKTEKGYLFHCSACNFQIHPCCAMLSAKMKFPTHPHSLVIMPATINSVGTTDMLCSECKKRRSGKVYQCTLCDYCLHAVCAKSMVNGLHANGIKGLDSAKPSMLGVAAKIASHVVVGFMGGLIEGIGEGLGEALTQNIVKGSHDSTRKSPINE
ncbi:uncharacterized protein LOC130798368 [Amaranthus tricolor]|uniref:uncharacterized protein LOC130798368 n=1 Tax=Amaranthus tricolor TaxID=29722 RepID=UPI00258D4820|nr:uncharacterized protein LOC130798368 [Amaranthus tricolor]